MKIAVYPGSFDPVTLGHLDIVKRASMMFDKVIVTVMHNSAKSSLFSVDERVKMIKEAVSEFKNVEVDSYDGLLIDYCKEKNIHIVVRGLRAITDFEYELQIAQSNKAQHSDLETVFLTTDVHYSYLSSTIVREFASYGGDISSFVPEEIIPLVEEKYRDLNR
jgi:pantetheine-phosphate adenylyltransferase